MRIAAAATRGRLWNWWGVAWTEGRAWAAARLPRGRESLGARNSRRGLTPQGACMGGWVEHIATRPLTFHGRAHVPWPARCMRCRYLRKLPRYAAPSYCNASAPPAFSQTLQIQITWATLYLTCCTHIGHALWYFSPQVLSSAFPTSPASAAARQTTMQHAHVLGQPGCSRITQRGGGPFGHTGVRGRARPQRALHGLQSGDACRLAWRERMQEAASRGLALLLAGSQATAAALALQLTVAVGPAPAVLTSPNAKIARSVDAALRRSIPAFNPEVASIQKSMEVRPCTLDSFAFKRQHATRLPAASRALALSQHRTARAWA